MLEILFCLFLFIIVFPLCLLYFISLGMPFILFLGFVIYNIVEYYYIKNQVKNICEKEAGIFVYVTPEQWREENKDILDILYPYGKINVNDIDKYEEMQQQKRKIETYYKTFNYNGNEYKKFSVFNRRLVLYSNYNTKKLNYFTKKHIDLLVDIKTDKVLVKTVYAHASVTGFMSVNRWSDLKEWMNEIPNCYDIVHDSSKLYEKFLNPSLEKGTENDKQNID